MLDRPRMCPSGCGSYDADADLCVVCGGPLVTRLIGVTFETWVAERLLGLGGSGATVWEARSFIDGSLVALKVAPAQTAEASRLHHTAALLSGLHHPNLTNLLAHGDSPDGPWLAMELVRGPTLMTLLQQRGSLTPTQSLHIAREVLRGLAYLHHHELVHRDLKPGNIHLTANHGAPWTVRLLDFGLATRPRDPRELIDLSAHPGTFGVIVGTPEYMAPEQVLGHEVDGRADLYALGVILYRLLTGHLPYVPAAPSPPAPSHSLSSTERHELYLAHLRAPPHAPRTPDGQPLPQPLVSALAAALQKQPRQRIASAEAFLAALSSE